MSWTRFDDKRPAVGTHVFFICVDKLWWGFYNPERKDGDPGFVPMFWIKVDPLPMFPKEEVAQPDNEVVESKEKIEVLYGSQDEKASGEAIKEGGDISKKSRKK